MPLFTVGRTDEHAEGAGYVEIQGWHKEVFLQSPPHFIFRDKVSTQPEDEHFG